jgi:methylated-DNA-protein-cysteine methyltransferase-like protein
MNELQRRIVEVLLALGEGEVTTYGDVAEVAGYPKRARFVGNVLAHAEELADVPGYEEAEIPWWRVVNAAGRLVPGHEAEQAQLLRAEGVSVRDGRVAAAPVGRFSSGSSR